MLPDLAGTGRGSALGDALMVVSTLVAAIYVIVSRKLVAGVAPLPLATLQQTVGLGWALAALGVAWAAGWSPGLAGLPAAKLLLSALTGVFQYALAFWFWLYGLRRLPAGRAGLFLSLIPVFGVTGAAVMLGERLSAAQWIGGAVVIGAVVGMVREEEEG
jgi:drug/metabolite transporter (DMT)-like permease